MITDKVSILGISGSLRLTSSNNVIMKLIASKVPEWIDFSLYQGLAGLPHFDDSPEIPTAVSHFHKALKEADAVLICTPEYAFGVPGSLKNALDWTVGTGDFVGKPVALITASSVGDKAHAALLNTLTAISADLAPERNLLISFVRSKLNEQGQITDASTAMAIDKLLDHLFNYTRQKKLNSINGQSQ